MCGKAKLLAATLKDFQKRWHHECLTSLQEVHKAYGSNRQTVMKGEVVLIHDDKPCTTWKMGIVDDLITGRDGIVCAVTLRTANGLTNQAVTRLYPLELCVATQPEMEQSQTEVDDATAEPITNVTVESSASSRPQRASAQRATMRMKEWTRALASCPPEDVATPEH